MGKEQWSMCVHRYAIFPPIPPEYCIKYTVLASNEGVTVGTTLEVKVRGLGLYSCLARLKAIATAFT